MFRTRLLNRCVKNPAVLQHKPLAPRNVTNDFKDVKHKSSIKCLLETN